MLNVTSLNAYAVVRSKTKAQNGFSITAVFNFYIQPNGMGVYQSRAPHTVNYMPDNTNVYAYYAFYHSTITSFDQSTATQNFDLIRHSKSQGNYYYPSLSITQSY